MFKFSHREKSKYGGLKCLFFNKSNIPINIHGNVHNAVVSSGSIFVAITARDSESFIKYLVESGILKSDASELAKIMEMEKPKSSDEPFGEKTQKWIANNIKKAVDGTWKIDVFVASKVLTEAAIKFYGL